MKVTTLKFRIIIGSQAKIKININEKLIFIDYYINILLLRPNKTDAFILLITRKRLKIFQFGKKYMKDPRPKNFPTLKFYYVILLKIGVNE